MHIDACAHVRVRARACVYCSVNMRVQPPLAGRGGAPTPDGFGGPYIPGPEEEKKIFVTCVWSVRCDVVWYLCSIDSSAGACVRMCVIIHYYVAVV